MNYRNNLDDLIVNQGYMSQRTKSPRRITSNVNMQPAQFYQNNDHYPNMNKVNKTRDISPNKAIPKTKPLLNGISTNNRFPLLNNNLNVNNYQSQMPIVDTQNKFNLDTKGQYAQQNVGWMNAKSPRSPQMDHQGFSQTNGTRTCFNHPGKKAEYMAETDGEVIYYCETCAAKLAAQCFEVIKLPISTRDMYGNNQFNQPKTKLMRKRRQIPCITKYKGSPVYESIIEFLKQIYTVQQYHYQTHQQLQTIDKHYDHQIQMVDQFYNQLMEILQKMHQDHVSDLHKERKKHSQMKDIYQNQIYENLQTIEQIVNDLDQNFQTVVNKITHQDIQFFNEALDKNRSNVRFFCNQIEQQRDMLSEVTSYQEQRLMQMISEYQSCLIQLWEQPKQHKPSKPQIFKPNPPQVKPQNNGSRQPTNMQYNQPVSSNNNILQPNNRSENVKNQHQNKINVLQIHQNNQKPSLARDFEGKGACRQIFQDDDEENLNQQISPKFKNI